MRASFNGSYLFICADIFLYHPCFKRISFVYRRLPCTFIINRKSYIWVLVICMVMQYKTRKAPHYPISQTMFRKMSLYLINQSFGTRTYRLMKTIKKAPPERAVIPHLHAAYRFTVPVLVLVFLFVRRFVIIIKNEPQHLL